MIHHNIIITRLRTYEKYPRMITRLQFCQSLAAVFIVSFAHASTTRFLFGQHPLWSKTSTLTVLKIEDGLLHPSIDGLLWPWPLTFGLLYPIRSSVGAIEYSRSVLSKLFEAFMRYRGNNICPDERTNERTNAADGQPENIMSSPTPTGGESITNL